MVVVLVVVDVDVDVVDVDVVRVSLLVVVGPSVVVVVVIALTLTGGPPFAAVGIAEDEIPASFKFGTKSVKNGVVMFAPPVSAVLACAVMAFT